MSTSYPSHKRPRVTTLDNSSSSDSSDDESGTDRSSHFISMLYPELDQVPILLVSGRWTICFDEMESDLATAVDQEFAETAMRAIRDLSLRPFDPVQLHRAFLLHHVLGIAYLVLFRHRDKYYTMFKGKRWSRGTRACVMPEFAHADVSVAPSNPSGVLSVPMKYALAASSFFLDLGMGEGSYMINMPATLRAGGYEINTNPLLMDQILHNILHYHPSFHFIPMDFSCVDLIEGESFTLFSWHPGTHLIPKISGCKVTAFIKGAKFENLVSQDLGLYSTKQSLMFYSNYREAPMVKWQESDDDCDCTDSTPPDDFVDIMSSFDLVSKLNGDTRKIRAHIASLEQSLSVTLPKWKTPEEARAALSTVPTDCYAKWVLSNVKWSLVKNHLLDGCHNMRTRMLLSCGVPQAECRNRIQGMLSAYSGT